MERTGLNPTFDFDNLSRDNGNDEVSIIHNHIDELKGSFNPVSHNIILSQLLKKIKPIDFKEKAGISDEDDLTIRHYLIIVIEEILLLARQNNWGLCRNHDFIYLYNGAYWSLLDTDEIKTFLGEAAENMGANKFHARYFAFRDKLYKQFIALANLPKPDHQKDVVLINLINGTFEVGYYGKRLRPFDPNDFLTYQLEFNYNPKAIAPIFTSYLNRVLPDKQSQLVLAEFLGYVFINSDILNLEKTLLLYGGRANGKSVMYRIVKSILGEQNTSEYTLQSLTNENGYYRAMISNKLVNYASEINGRLETAMFKAMVSGEPIEARLPYGNPFIVTRYAKLIFNCNELPKDVEQTNAYFRRFLIVPFDVTIQESEQDKELAKKIITNELPGVFNWILEGLDRLLQQKQFSFCDAADKARRKYEIQSDSVRLFIDENDYSNDPIRHISIKELYVDYRIFCTDNGFKPVNKVNFNKRLEYSGINIERKSGGKVAFIIKNSKIP
jgi:putative DNA primase/helicase